MAKKLEIAVLEERNSELAKEILLNEAAVYEAEREIRIVEAELLTDVDIQKHIHNLSFLIERIELRNRLYREEIFENNLRINKLK
jgi:hypothetical protein